VPVCAQTSASAGTGSTEAVEVVPTVATTIAASDRSSPSARMRYSSSGHRAQLHAQHPRALLERRVRVLGADGDVAPVTWRAAISAASVEVEAASSMWPCQPPGRPSSCATQSVTTPSSSVEAGEVRHRNATGFSAAASISARIAGREALAAK
jgi:hypothetical protein